MKKLSHDQVLAQFGAILAQAKSVQLAKWTRQTLSRALVWSSLAQRAEQKRDATTTVDQRTMLLQEILLNPYCPSDLRTICLQKLSPQAQARVEQMQHTMDSKMETLRSLDEDDEAIKRLMAERVLEKLKTSEHARVKVEQRCMQGDIWMLDCLKRMCAIERANPQSFVHVVAARTENKTL